MSATARSTPNIALIKYWGNRNDALRLPAADSLSMTLDSPSVEITVDHADVMTVQSFAADGSQKTLKEKDVARFARHLELTTEYLAKLGVQGAIPSSISITVRSHIPSSVGLASSAAVFGCLAKAYAGLFGEAAATPPRLGSGQAPSLLPLTDEQVSVIARFGSGSAARSIYGGYAALQTGTGEDPGSSFAVQIADEHHWLLHDIILVPTQEEKKVGSTEGHGFAWTSPYYKKRLEAIPRRQKECTDAILTKDFEKLQRVTEEDCWDMHNVMQTSTPALQYLNDETYRITDEIEQLREREHLPILYTMDAGSTVHVICQEEAVKAVRDFAHAQKGCTIFEAKTGSGAILR